LKKIIELIIFVMMVFIASNCCYATDLINDNYTLRYYVQMKKEQKKGLLSLKKMKTGFESEYGGDKIPLFFPKKSGTFVDSIYSTSLEFGEKKYTIYLDTANTPKRVKRFIKGAKDNKSVLVDQENNLPTLLFEKIPMVTIENIIIGFLTQRIRERESMMLYEEGINQHARIYFLRDQQETIEIDKLRCTATRYICKRTSVPGTPDKNSFYVWRSPSGIPVRIAAANGKWDLMIHAIGHEATLSYDIAKDCEVYAQNHIQKLMQTKADTQISPIGFRNNQFSYQYNVAIPLKIPDPKEICVEYFMKKLSINRTCNEPYVFKNIEKEMIHFDSNKIAAYINIDFLSCMLAVPKKQLQTLSVTIQKFINTVQPYYAQSVVYKKNSAGQYALFEKSRPLNLKNASQHYLNITQDFQSPDIRVAENASIENTNSEELNPNRTKIMITYSAHRESTLRNGAARNFMLRVDSRAKCLNESLVHNLLKRGRNGFQITFTAQSYDSFLQQKLETQCLNHAMPLKLKSRLKDRKVSMAQKKCFIQGQDVLVMNSQHKKELLLKLYPDLQYLGYSSIQDNGQQLTFKYVNSSIPICQ